MTEKQDLDQNNEDPEDKQGDRFPAGQAREVMAKKEKREANDGDNSGDTEPWDFEFKVSAEDSASQ